MLRQAVAVRSGPRGPLAELGPTPLAIYLWTQFEQATEDLPHLNVTEAVTRFLTWSRRS